MAATIAYDAEQLSWKSFDYPHRQFIQQTIGEVFIKNARITDSAKVLEFYYDTGLQRTMGDIYRESVTVAVNLQRLGVKCGDILVLYSMVNPKVSPITLGSFLLGVTVNFFEPKFDKEQIEHMLHLLSPTLILFEEQFKTAATAAVDRLNLPQLKYFLSMDADTDAATVDRMLLKPIRKAEIDSFQPPLLGDPEQLMACLLLTSGTTGLSKAVALSHAQLLNGMLTFWEHPEHRMQLTAESVIFSFSPLRWISQVDLMLESLLLGTKRVCANNYPTGAYGRDIIKHGRITHFFSPPSVFNNILLATDSHDMEALGSLQYVLLGGETPKQTVLNLAAAKAPKAKIFRCYGMTEIGGCIASDLHVNGGCLITGLELKILDDNLKFVGPNVRGQLCIRTPVPFLGYYKYSKNSESYREDGYFNTGDYGSVDDNKALHVIGRYKDLVSAKGIILVPTEVENLVTTLPGVLYATLVGYRTIAGTTEDTGAIFVEVNIDEQRAKEDIQKLLQLELLPAEFKIIRNIHIIDAYPLTSCGKIDKVALREMAKRLV